MGTVVSTRVLFFFFFFFFFFLLLGLALILPLWLRKLPQRRMRARPRRRRRRRRRPPSKYSGSVCDDLEREPGWRGRESCPARPAAQLANTFQLLSGRPPPVIFNLLLFTAAAAGS